MTVTFFDCQDDSSLLNGAVLDSDADLDAVLQKPPDRDPFFCELLGQGERRLLIGLGGEFGCVEYRPGDGASPRLLAAARGAREQAEASEFLFGDTPTPVPGRYRLPAKLVLETAAFFLRTGGLNPNVTWEEI